MSGITLLSGGTKYSSIIKRNLKQDSDTVVLLSDPGTAESVISVADKNRKKDDKRDLGIVWNKRSSLSARNVLLTALNAYSSIDKAVLIYQPGDYSKTFHETSAAVYDLQIDRWIKGYGYLLKELIQLFLKQQKGQLSFILDTDGMKVMTPLESAIFSYLKTLIQNLAVLYQDEPVRIFCFESDSTRRDEFLDFFNKVVSDQKYAAGRIHRFTDKKSLFDFGKN